MGRGFGLGLAGSGLLLGQALLCRWPAAGLGWPVLACAHLLAAAARIARVRLRVRLPHTPSVIHPCFLRVATMCIGGGPFGCRGPSFARYFRFARCALRSVVFVCPPRRVFALLGMRVTGLGGRCQGRRSIWSASAWGLSSAGGGLSCVSNSRLQHRVARFRRQAGDGPLSAGLRERGAGSTWLSGSRSTMYLLAGGDFESTVGDCSAFASGGPKKAARGSMTSKGSGIRRGCRGAVAAARYASFCAIWARNSTVKGPAAD